jgi:hypothetical protein
MHTQDALIFIWKLKIKTHEAYILNEDIRWELELNKDAKGSTDNLSVNDKTKNLNYIFIDI